MFYATDTATVWTYTEGDPGNPFDDGSWARDTVAVCISAGGKTQTDQDGAEFVPQTTYYTGTQLFRGQRVKEGAHADPMPPTDAETIRKVDTWTPMPGQSREFAVYTG